MALRRSPTSTHWGNYDVEVSAGQVVALHPAAEDADPSPIGAGMPRALRDASRILRPAVRRGWLEGDGGARRGEDAFVEVGWDEALDLAARELARVKDEHGNASIYGGSYGWGSAGRFHHPQGLLHRFLNFHGGYTASVNTYSCAALMVILPHVIGGAPDAIYSSAPQWGEIAEHGELVVAFGGLALKNTQVNPGGVGRHLARSAQYACQEAGVEFVNVSPVRGDADAQLGARWIAPRPNTDVALMLGLAHTMIANGTHDERFLRDSCVGWDEFEAYVTGRGDGVPRDAAWAAAICDIEASVIETLAAEMTAKRTLVTVSWSLQRADHGEQPYWMAVALAAMTGSMGRPGGGFGCGYGAMHSVGMQPDRRGIASLAQGQNAITAKIPVARIADLLLEPGATIDFDGQRVTFPDIRLVYWCGGNPFHHHQDLNRLVGAWRLPETVIVHESWWNPVARFADIVFPAAAALERNDLAAGRSDSWLSAMHRAVDPPGEVRTDYETFCGLADGLGFREAFSEGRDGDEWVRHLYETTRANLQGDVDLPPFEEFWATGRVEMPTPPRRPALDFAGLRADPAASPLPTPSGRIEIGSATIAGFGYDDCPGHPTWLEPAEWLGSELARRFPLHLISNQPTTRLHSQYDNGGYSQDSKVQGREPIRLHPEDARARGIADGDVVRVFNDRGSCLAGAVLDANLRRSVVQLATGAWWDPVAPGDPQALDRHGNPNALTLDKGTSRLAQGPISHTTLVELERYEGPLPAIQAFTPPELI
jgi:biotin/methionine sulfoxide reductase